GELTFVPMAVASLPVNSVPAGTCLAACACAAAFGSGCFAPQALPASASAATMTVFRMIRLPSRTPGKPNALASLVPELGQHRGVDGAHRPARQIRRIEREQRPRVVQPLAGRAHRGGIDLNDEPNAARSWW